MKVKTEPEFSPNEIPDLEHAQISNDLTAMPRKNKQTDLPYSFQWKEVLNDAHFSAAPVHCFKFSPGKSAWKDINIGMRLEVENTDCEDYSEQENEPYSFWVATVLQISGYYALLRYVGFGDCNSKDFWVHMGLAELRPVGWCAVRGKPLIPPKSIEHKYNDWIAYLLADLQGAQTLSDNFTSKLQSSLTSRFKFNMIVEVVDKNRISQVKVATIQKIVGKRLHVHYYDSHPNDDGFVCHEDSPLLHPVGWAKTVGATICAPAAYTERCNAGKWTDMDATLEYFLDFEYDNIFMEDSKLEVGMKLEAIDPLNLSSICVATVMQVLQENFVMIRIDSYAEDLTESDWFCFHTSSPCIFPAGFCNVNKIPLTPPKGYKMEEFSWSAYLEETGLTTAPLAIFHREIPKHGFRPGMRLEAADLMAPHLVCVGTISRVVGRLLKVHFDGWEEEYDQWLDCESPDIYPVGWCELVGHKLQGPLQAQLSVAKGPALSPTKGGRGAKRKVGGRRQRRGKIAMPSRRAAPSATVVSACSPSPELAASSPPSPITQVEPSSSSEVERTMFEPETGQEPAGPDQSMPVATEQSPAGMPKERMATSYINSSGASTKIIPRLVDATGAMTEAGEVLPEEWNVYDVAQFLRVNDCAAYCDSFSKKKIDGLTLLRLSKDDIIDLTGMKVGPSLKIFDLIQQLKVKVKPAERLKALKKLSS